MHACNARILRQSIEEEQRKLAEARQSIAARPCADDNEMASFYESADVTITLMQRARQRLLYLERNMAVLETRPHCLCEDCGEEISLRRREARPDALRCAACQADWEEEQRRLYAATGFNGYTSHLYTA